MAKRGPKTDGGKARVRLNAVKHGVLCNAPVISGAESEEEWEAHRLAMIESLDARGYAEVALPELAALNLERLQRVARFEADVVAVELEELEEDWLHGYPEAARILGRELPRPIDLKNRAERAKLDYALVRRFRGRKHNALLSGASAERMLSSVAHAAGVELEGLHFSGVPTDADWKEFTGWTAGLVRQGIADIASRVGKDAEQLPALAMSRERQAQRQNELLVRVMRRHLERNRHRHMLPPDHKLELLLRYDQHASRHYYQAPH